MFALDTLEKLKTFKERIHFAENNLKVIGVGTSRIVFEYGDKVFKLAKNRKGIMQNKIEILKSKSNFDLFAKIFDYSPTNKWLIMEKTFPVSFDDFEKYADIKWEHMLGFMAECILINISEKYKDYYEFFIKQQYKGTKSILNNFHKLKYNKEKLIFLNNIYTYFSTGKPEFYDWADFHLLSTWGLSVRNGGKQLVIIDYGVNKEVFMMYNKNFNMDEFFNLKNYDL